MYPVNEILFKARGLYLWYSVLFLYPDNDVTSLEIISIIRNCCGGMENRFRISARFVFNACALHHTAPLSVLLSVPYDIEGSL